MHFKERGVPFGQLLTFDIFNKNGHTVHSLMYTLYMYVFVDNPKLIYTITWFLLRLGASPGKLSPACSRVQQWAARYPKMCCFICTHAISMMQSINIPLLSCKRYCICKR